MTLKISKALTIKKTLEATFYEICIAAGLLCYHNNFFCHSFGISFFHCAIYGVELQIRLEGSEETNHILKKRLPQNCSI